ncbi:MAG: ornithine--oxo-acid transaminase [Candidatus Heimdallarchaeum endolithica]|uniref:ornithine aminotransferase n=1 Tax=Candidatus Heimdallarchaeum endolithica TaxID=2876572 RepID=A0A9Y1BTD0_9ARCH|nr:MAG: ornithine--oxo-acid transaminase [Candidatus Heimdallarchaeum endolithica]
MDNSNSKTKYFLDLDKKNTAHNYKPIPVVIKKAKGIWVWDVDGKKYLDCLSAYSSQNFGHRHPKLVNALKKQLNKVILTSRAFCNDSMGKAAKKLCELTGYEVFLPMNTGAEAVESALKIARKWGYEKKNVEENKAEIIVCENNFHGRTITIVGFSTDPDCYSGFGPKTPGFKIIPYGDIEALKKAITKNTVGFLVEPIQGEAGVIVPPEGYLKEAYELCKEKNVLFIADEIQTGFCRTGKLFASEYEDIKPDMTLVAKAVGGGVWPVSGVLSSWEIMDVLTPGTHGSTWGGNSAGMAVLEAVCDLVKEQDFSGRARELGQFFMDGLKKIQKKYPDKIKEVRGKGLLVAIELKVKARPYTEALKNNEPVGVLAKETHSYSIRFAPPLTISEKDLTWALEVIDKVFGEI